MRISWGSYSSVTNPAKNSRGSLAEIAGLMTYSALCLATFLAQIVVIGIGALFGLLLLCVCTPLLVLGKVLGGGDSRQGMPAAEGSPEMPDREEKLLRLPVTYHVRTRRIRSH